MRADIGTTVTLDTVFRIPYRDIYCDTTFFESSRTGRSRTIYIILECRYRQVVTFLSVNCMLDSINEINNVFSVTGNSFSDDILILSIFPALRNLDLNYLFSTGVDSIVVHLNDSITLTSVSSLCSSFHQVDSFCFRNDVSQFEECRLQNSVDTSAQTDLFTDLDTVDHIEFDVVLSDESLYLTRQMFLQTFHIPRAVQQECTTVNQLLNHIVLTYVGRIVACYEVSLFDQICRFDRSLTETKVRHGHTTGFLGIIIKVSLSIHISVVTDDLDGVLVSTYSTVGTQTPELAVDGSCRSSNQRSANLKRQIGNIIYDTQSEFLFCCVVVNSNDLCRCGILGTKTVTACEYRNSFELGAFQSGNNVQIQRLAHSARLFSSIQNSDLFNCLRDSIDQSGC